MSQSRPSTPGATPRKPFTSSSRTPSRASSRPASPVKVSTQSINNNASSPFPRPSSSLALNGSNKNESRPSSSLSQRGRSSPSKRSSSPTKTTTLRPIRPPVGASLADPFASNSSISSVTSTLSQISRRTAVGGGSSSLFREREDIASTRSSDASCSNGGDTTDDDQDPDREQPRRRAGFGPLTPSTKRNFRGNETETETEGEGGFLTAEEGALTDTGGNGRNRLRGSIIERSEEEVGNESADETETETVEAEEDKDGKKENVVVCLRVRPAKSTSSSTEIYNYRPAHATLSLAASHPTLVKRGGKTSDEYDFRFDLLHVSPDPTSKLYDRKIRPVVKAALNGFNGTVFAYGQTASGKTHTMMGSSKEPGVIPLAIDELFSHIHKQNTNRTYSLRVSFLEIYNEQLRDLLSTSSSTTSSLQASRQPEIVEGGTVKNLEERPVSMPQEVLEVLREGEQRRRVGQTDWNERSSRSHCVFIVTIESMSKHEDGSARTSKLNLIDLAGSESATGQEERRKEGSFINKSLLTLGTVIGKLTEQPHSSTAHHVPYRDSKLTRLLQPALSGNSRVAVICTISPDIEQATETLSTLKFAKRVKMVVTKAERGVLVTDQMMLKQYAAQVERLQSRIKSVEAGEVLRERDLAARRADEAERLGKEARDALAEKELELARLRSQLAQTQSLILNGPSLEANARRVSGSFAGSMLSPSRSRSLNMGVGRRELSEAGGIGLGTPRAEGRSWSSSLGESVSASGRREEESLREQENALAHRLEEANQKLASLSNTESELATLRTQLHQLQRSSSLARLDAEKSAQANEDRKARIRELEAELALVRETLRSVEEDRRRMLEEMSKLRSELDWVKEENRRTVDSLAEVERKLISAEETARTKDGQLSGLQSDFMTVRQQLEKKEADSRLPDPKDDKIASFERQVQSIKEELAIITAAKAEAVQAALAEVEGARKERDLTARAVEEGERRIRDLEEMAELQTKRHELAEEQIVKEQEAATAVLQAEIDSLKEDLAAKINRVAHLERTVETLENLEARRKKYESDQRSGLDKLKSRMEDMRAKSAAQTQSPRAPLVPSTASSSLSCSTGSQSGASQKQQYVLKEQQQQVKDLQIRNGELLARVADLQRAVDAGIGQEEKCEMEGTIKDQRRKLVETEAKAEDWRQKFLAAQRLLDKLTSKSQLETGSFGAESENEPPTPLAELKLTSPFSRMSLSSSTSSLRPSLNFASTSLARASSTNASRSPLPPPPASPSPPLQGSSFWSQQNKPPPLPSSPHQRTSAARERNIRRKTIAKDLVNLQASKVVDQRREGWDSPNGSPTKSDLERGASKRFSTDLLGQRERKGSWE
ncbi:hypothetical protein JCM3765_002879 [Sporobolomyces pararoseus]